MTTFHTLKGASKGGNLGLWWAKFFDKWPLEKPDDQFKLAEDGKREWVKAMGGPVGVREELKEHTDRIRNLCKSGKPLHFRTTGRLVVGLGYNHPVENGFTFHHTLGVPYLPGSTVKGLVYAYARDWEQAPAADLTRIFGSSVVRERNGETSRVASQAGSVLFLDALPVEPPTLEPEVMTPHYGPWYASGDPPADWHNPVPIPFLAVASGAEFLFGLLPRKADTMSDVEQCARWLEAALTTLGIGAKTAVGYGRMEVTLDPQVKQWEEELKSLENNIRTLKWNSMRAHDPSFSSIAERLLKLPDHLQSHLLEALRNHKEQVLRHHDLPKQRNKHPKVEELCKKLGL